MGCDPDTVAGSVCVARDLAVQRDATGPEKGTDRPYAGTSATWRVKGTEATCDPTDPGGT